MEARSGKNGRAAIEVESWSLSRRRGKLCIDRLHGFAGVLKLRFPSIFVWVSTMKCRHCHAEVVQKFIDLGASPPSNAYLSSEALSTPEMHFPLRVLVCTNCWLVQTEDFTRAEELFNRDYAYFSSISQIWLKHSALFAAMIVDRLHLGSESLVIEVASNDGYLLENFLRAGIPCMGIEPTDSTAAVAESKGIPVLKEFFGAALALGLADSGKRADLIVGNNVYAHVPDINDFTAGLRTALKPGGVVTLEFPHIMQLIEHTQFDTIYHEHFSYLSLHTVARIFETEGLRVWDVEKLSTHGGSLRIYGCHREDSRPNTPMVSQVLLEEMQRGLLGADIYCDFQRKADVLKYDLLAFLIEKKRQNKSVVGYGAAAKGNTLLNYSGIKSDLIKFVCDAGPSKQGKYLPGSHIAILSPAALRAYRPDYILILPWNIADEVIDLHGYVGEWGGRFLVAVPNLEFR
jgi:SAM-dependent methyltransferase